MAFSIEEQHQVLAHQAERLRAVFQVFDFCGGVPEPAQGLLLGGQHGRGVLSFGPRRAASRSEEHTSELQSLMRISYAVFCLKKKKNMTNTHDREVRILPTNTSNHS